MQAKRYEPDPAVFSGRGVTPVPSAAQQLEEKQRRAHEGFTPSNGWLIPRTTNGKR